MRWIAVDVCGLCSSQMQEDGIFGKIVRQKLKDLGKGLFRIETAVNPEAVWKPVNPGGRKSEI